MQMLSIRLQVSKPEMRTTPTRHRHRHSTQASGAALRAGREDDESARGLVKRQMGYIWQDLGDDIGVYHVTEVIFSALLSG